MSEKNSLKSSVESLLFVSGEPMKLAKIAKICEVSKDEVAEEIETLNANYKNS